MQKMLHTLRNLHSVANNSKVERICCVCRKMQPITQMTRVVRVQGDFLLQGNKRLSGRGAHVCPQCIQSPNLQKCLSRSFKAPFPSELISQIVKSN